MKRTPQEIEALGHSLITYGDEKIDAFRKGYLAAQADQPIDQPVSGSGMTDAQRSAVSLFTCWWAMVEAERDLIDDPIRDDAVVLNFMGSGASCTVFAKHIRILCALLSASSQAAPVNVPSEWQAGLKKIRGVLHQYLKDHPHSAPHDCYATGPATGDEIFDLVRCPGCCAENGFKEAIAAIDTMLAAAPAPVVQEAQQSEKDAALLDWIERQGDEFSTGVLTDQPGDGEYFVHGCNCYGQGKTLRDALHAALAAEQNKAGKEPSK